MTNDPKHTKAIKDADDLVSRLQGCWRPFVVKVWNDVWQYGVISAGGGIEIRPIGGADRDEFYAIVKSLGDNIYSAIFSDPNSAVADALRTIDKEIERLASAILRLSNVKDNIYGSIDE